MSKGKGYIAVFVFLVFMTGFVLKVQREAGEISYPVVEETTTKAEIITQEPVVTTAPAHISDPDNLKYPFDKMSVDCGEELYESGFTYYHIPEEYAQDGGCFPEVMQAYLWYMCEDRDIDYYLMLALIERESQYKFIAIGDKGNSLGYMQIYKKWHEERMEQEEADDLLDPYQNIRVGTNFFAEIQDKYLENSGIHCVLMVYNMGEEMAKGLWEQEIYSTEYSRGIVSRAQEIRQELKQE